MLYLDSSPARDDISLKKGKKKGMIHSSIKGEIRKFVNYHIWKIVRQL
jgi:hypothetical protein